MTYSSLLIIHQGALGDVVLTFPAIIGLRKKFSRVDVLCQSQLGKLAAVLGLAEKWYSLEAACFATLFSEQVDEKIKDILAGYSTILLFSFACDLKKSISQITDSQCFRIPPRPPALDKIHVAEFLFKNLIDCGLLETAGSNDKSFTAGETNPQDGQADRHLKNFNSPGLRQQAKALAPGPIFKTGVRSEKKGITAPICMRPGRVGSER
jgi:hypothetical protein